MLRQILRHVLFQDNKRAIKALAIDVKKGNTKVAELCKLVGHSSTEKAAEDILAADAINAQLPVDVSIAKPYPQSYPNICSYSTWAPRQRSSSPEMT